jgi:hypothetical protein
MNRELAISAEEEIAEIKRKHREICEAPRRLLATAIEIGQWFIVQHEKIEHGEWLPWLRENFPDISERTVQRYALLAENREFLEWKYDTASFLDSPSITASLREIKALEKEDMHDDPPELEAGRPEERDKVVVRFPSAEAAPEKSAPTAPAADDESADDPAKTLKKFTKALAKEIGAVIDRHKHDWGFMVSYGPAEVGKVEEVIETECGWRETAIVDRGRITINFYRERNARRERIERPAARKALISAGPVSEHPFLDRLERARTNSRKEEEETGV